MFLEHFQGFTRTMQYLTELKTHTFGAHSARSKEIVNRQWNSILTELLLSCLLLASVACSK